jgi:hypothetical protein
MKTICSFCNTIIRAGDSPDGPVSHGICRPCYDRILANNGFNVRKYLDLLDAPVFLVDDDVNILAANALAIAAVKKPVVQVREKICGKVLDCINANLPEGCGRTGFCPDCTIRSTVNETYATGHQVNRRPAVFCRRTGGKEETMSLLVSTRKDGGIVLLRLEPVEVV